MDAYSLKRRYKVGIVGAGVVSPMHLEGLKRHPELVEIHALCDADEQKLIERSEQYLIPNRYTSVEKMIAESSMDAVILCTPSHLRKEIISLFFQARIPVFCEKPLAETYEQAHEIAELSVKHNVPLQIDQNFRRFFSFHIGRRLLQGGAPGKPLHLTQAVNGLRRDIGWRLTRERYVMAVMSNHWFDGYRYMMQSEPKSVYCKAVPAPGGVSRDIAVSVMLEFENGCIVSLSESFNSYTGLRGSTLDCTNGGFIMDYKRLEMVSPSGEKTIFQNPYDKPEATFYLFYDLLKSIEEKRQPEAGVEDNLKTMKIFESAYRSLEKDRVVKLGEW
ncbi:Gfo/Idh/MocA family protein [Paenibacillus humicola]|uniref:Gfo/Idh/MocA family protein n=1 Tax=Paenibacillus humicola TaxID=3110540 RepID=UPI00237B9D5F|nr:Gfo/Idh/MocA family oxidoreductase [Paenibacillus humicola]